MNTKYIKPKMKEVATDCEYVFAAGSNQTKSFNVSGTTTTETALSKESYFENDNDWED